MKKFEVKKTKVTNFFEGGDSKDAWYVEAGHSKAFFDEEIEAMLFCDALNEEFEKK